MDGEKLIGRFGGDLSVTVNTDDAVVLEEVGLMFTRLARRVAGSGGPEETFGFERRFRHDALDTAVYAAAGVSDTIKPGVELPDPTTEEMQSALAKVDTATIFGGATIPPVPPASTGSVVPPPPASPVSTGHTRTDCVKLHPETGACTVFGTLNDCGAVCSAYATSAPTPAVDLDKNGLPWDARINTSNKAKTGPGVYKRRPGLSDEEYNGVLAELKATMGAPAPAAGPATPPAVPPAPAASPTTPTAPPAPVDEEAPTTFAKLMEAVTKRTACDPPKLTPDEVNAVCALHGVPSLALMHARLDLIPTVFKELKAIWDTRA